MDYKFDDFKDDYDEDEDYIDREDELAFMHSLCSAFNGDVASMRVLGDIYSSSGHGVVKDYNKAAYWYKRAADCGDNNCLLCLADIYFDGGEDFPKDYDKAFSLYELAEEEGSIRGAARLGIMYLYGMGCDKDFKAARGLLERAAKENDREACCEYALILKAEGAEDWFEYLEKSANQSYGKACWEIIGNFADKIDDKQFIMYLSSAASYPTFDYDPTEARLMIADCFMYGKRVKKDVNYARSYLITAAEDGSEEARELLIKYFGFY